jgi:hypothetical protein
MVRFAFRLIDWDSRFGDKSVEKMWQEFVSEYQLVVNQYVGLPSKRGFRPTNVRDRPPWMNRELLAVISKKSKAFHRYRQYRDTISYQEYVLHRSIAKQAIGQAV